ncbi:MAG: iron-sulfur cluster assembly accessory protein [Ferruginibacter sp.]
METTLNIPVTLTLSAANEIRRLQLKEDFDNSKKLRIGVKGGGCSGMTYILDFDAEGKNDEYFELEGISCIMDRSHAIYLTGMNIDWEGGLNSRGFTFNNPNASTTCGCGTSFGV